MADSPTTRTLKLLRAEGWLAAVVEHWNVHAHIRQDLFGIIDILAVRGSETIAVQATTNANQASRVTKIKGHTSTPYVLESGWRLEVWGWKAYKKKVDRRSWRETRTVITVEDLT